MKVSVIIPVYNAAPFLDKSIQSALNQKQTNEVLLVDDRSTDISMEICRKWETKDSRVRVFSNTGVKGAGAARNIGLKNATSEFIAFLDADDYFLDGRFEQTEKLFQNTFHIDGVSESAIVTYLYHNDLYAISGKYNENEIFGYKINNTLIDPKLYLKHSNLLITGITIKKKSIVNEVLFDVELKQTQDTDFLLSLFRSKSIISGNFNKPVVAYFMHEKNTTKNFTETAYYRHLFYRKHVLLCLKGFYHYELLDFLFTRYVEYSFLVSYKIRILPKKFNKLLMMPYYIFLLFINNPKNYQINK